MQYTYVSHTHLIDKKEPPILPFSRIWARACSTSCKNLNVIFFILKTVFAQKKVGSCFKKKYAYSLMICTLKYFVSYLLIPIPHLKRKKWQCMDLPIGFHDVHLASPTLSHLPSRSPPATPPAHGRCGCRTWYSDAARI